MAIVDAIERYLTRPTPPPGSTEDEMELRSFVADEPAAPTEIRAAWPNRELPRDVVDLWLTCREAELFKDMEYGQWGLRVLSPDDSARVTRSESRERPDDYRVDDVIIGQFRGHPIYVVFAPSDQGDRRVLVTEELYPRVDWTGVASSLEEFLNRYFDGHGRLYWEQ